MIHKVFVAIIVVVAVIVGLLNITQFHTDAIRLAMFGEFFSAALPILAFGALVKYLCCFGSSCKCCYGSGCKCCGSDKICPTTTTDIRR
jgi:hypothetical protein